MCRWLTYTGDPVLLDELLYKPRYSLIVQSLHSRLGAETTNGDGFGVGWYGAAPAPGVFHGVEPAWNDRHLRELATHVAVATTDGERVWAFRYSSEGRSHSLFHSTDVSTLRHQYPDNPMLHDRSDQTRLVVSEPVGDLTGAWREVPEVIGMVISEGRYELQPFTPGVLATTA